MNATATTPTTVTIPTTVTTPTIPTRSVHDITGDNYAELTAIAASVGINWQSVSEQITSYPFKITRGIELERKYQGKVACFGRLYKSKSGKEYPRINFHTNKHGGITETWNGYNAEHDNPIPFTPKPRQPKTKDNSDEWRTKRFNAAKALFKDLPTETGEHSYLISKFQAQAPDVAKLTDIRRGADEHGSYIMVELMRSGFVAGYQKIYDKNIKSRETNKDYIVNAEGKNGAYLLIDGDSDKIYITEGLATGLTVDIGTVLSGDNVDIGTVLEWG